MNTISELEEYASNNNVPIIEKDSIEYICTKIRIFSLYNILEIGTAIGYSAINFAMCNSKVKVTSIERDRNRFLEAVKNVKSFGYNEQIELIFNDALNTEISDKYNLIFIDAAKGQNINFFNKFKPNLDDNGFIIVDNMNFHGLVGKSKTIESKDLRQLVTKIENFREFLKEQDGFYIELLDIGDGLAICQKKVEK